MRISAKNKVNEAETNYQYINIYCLNKNLSVKNLTLKFKTDVYF